MKLLKKLGLQLGGYCLWCKQWMPDIEWLCRDCEQHLPWLEVSCQQCAYPTTGQSVCGRCLEWPPIRTQALFRYEYPIKDWLYKIKYGNQFWLGTVLGQMMATKAIAEDRQVIWVPTPRDRLRQRGYNPAWLFAQSVYQHYKLPHCQPFTVESHLPSQARLKRAKRIQLARKRFSLVEPVSAQKVLLVDDILTTGATILSLCHLLFKQGVKDIQVLVLARSM